jgi:hypothetical protein
MRLFVVLNKPTHTSAYSKTREMLSREEPKQPSKFFKTLM